MPAQTTVWIFKQNGGLLLCTTTCLQLLYNECKYNWNCNQVIVIITALLPMHA